MKSFFAGWIVAGALIAGSQAAQAQGVDCAGYANSMVSLQLRAQRARILHCPGWQNHADWQAHFSWCARQNPRTVRRMQNEYNVRFDGCVSSYGRGGGGARPPVAGRPLACNGLAGRYNRGVITVDSANRVRVTVGPNRPVAFGSCRGNRLTVDFRDDRVISGVFDGRTIAWDNRTFWTKH